MGSLQKVHEPSPATPQWIEDDWETEDTGTMISILSGRDYEESGYISVTFPLFIPTGTWREGLLL